MNNQLLAGGNTLVEGFNAGCPLLCSLQGKDMIRNLTLPPTVAKPSKEGTRVQLPDKSTINLRFPRVKIEDNDIALAVYNLGRLVDENLLKEIERGCQDTARNQQEAGMSLYANKFFGPYLQLEQYYIQASFDYFRAILYGPITIDAPYITCGITFQFRSDFRGKTGIRKIV